MRIDFGAPGAAARRPLPAAAGDARRQRHGDAARRPARPGRRIAAGGQHRAGQYRQRRRGLAGGHHGAAAGARRHGAHHLHRRQRRLHLGAARRQQRHAGQRQRQLAGRVSRCRRRRWTSTASRCSSAACRAAATSLTVEPTPASAMATNNGNALALLGAARRRPGRRPHRQRCLVAGHRRDRRARAERARVGRDLDWRWPARPSCRAARVAGVNLDEEAARLIQFQQSYQAAAKVLQVAQSLVRHPARRSPPAAESPSMRIATANAFDVLAGPPAAAPAGAQRRRRSSSPAASACCAPATTRPPRPRPSARWRRRRAATRRCARSTPAAAATQLTESALGEAGELLQQARELLVARRQRQLQRRRPTRPRPSACTACAATCSASANRSDSDGRYLFGGQGSDGPPLLDGPGGVSFNGIAGQAHGGRGLRDAAVGGRPRRLAAGRRPGAAAAQALSVFDVMDRMVERAARPPGRSGGRGDGRRSAAASARSTPARPTCRPGARAPARR